jgi:hypothetical protein
MSSSNPVQASESARQGARMAELRTVMLSAVSDADMAAITEQLVVRAREGQMAAIKLVLRYALHEPPTVRRPILQAAPMPRAGSADKPLSAKALSEGLRQLESALGACEMTHSSQRIGGGAAAPSQVNGQHADGRRSGTAMSPPTARPRVRRLTGEVEPPRSRWPARIGTHTTL